MAVTIAFLVLADCLGSRCMQANDCLASSTRWRSLAVHRAAGVFDLVCCSQFSQPLLHATLRVVFGSRDGVTVTAKSDRFLFYCIDL